MYLCSLIRERYYTMYITCSLYRILILSLRCSLIRDMNSLGTTGMIYYCSLISNLGFYTYRILDYLYIPVPLSNSINSSKS